MASSTSPDRLRNVRKRARPVLSCVECRRKKLKCNRTLPCLQCSRFGRANECTFEDREILPPLPVPQAAQGDGEGLLDLQKRIRDIERRLTDAPAGSHLSGAPHRDPSRVSVFKAKRLAKKGSSTRFHGHLNWKALHPEFQEVESFVSRFDTDPKYLPLKQALFSLKRAFPKTKQVTSSGCVPSNIPFMEQLQGGLPERHMCNILVEKYFQTFARLFPLLEANSFIQRSEAFWRNATDIKAFDCSFMALYAGVLCLGSRFVSHAGIVVSDVTTKCEKLLPLVESWVATLKGKKRIQTEIVSIRLLLVLCKMTQMIRFADLWLELGDLLQLAIAVGLHRDPSEFDIFPDMEAEQRRCVWFSVAEVCLQVSMDNSMPIMLDGADVTCQHPRMAPKLMKTFSLRLDVWKLLTKTDRHFDREALVHQLRPLQKMVSGEALLSPRYLGVLPIEKFVQHMEDMLLCRVLTYAYRELAFDSDVNADEALTHLQTMCLNLLQLQGLWHPSSTVLPFAEANDYWNLWHSIFKIDIIHSVLCLSLQLKLDKVHDQNLIGSAFKPTATTISKTVQETIGSLFSRVAGVGKDLRIVMFLRLIYCCVNVKASQDEKDSVMEDETRRVIASCQNLLLTRLSSSNAETSTALVGMSMNATRESTEPPYVTGLSQDTVYLTTTDLTTLIDGFDATMVDFSSDMVDWLFDM